MNKSKLMELDIRLGYKDEITLSRNEFKELIEGDPDEIADLKSKIEDLEGEVESAEYANIELKGEIAELEKEIKELEKQLEEKNNE